MTSRSIQFVGIDVDVFDVKAALPVVIEKLRQLGAPQGTVIEESRGAASPLVHQVW